MAFQQQHSGLFVVPESPQLPAKRMRTEAVSAHTSTGIGTEMRKLVVSTCRNIAYVECTLDKQQKKLQTLEEHVSLGTVPKDLLLPKKEGSV